jgi:hypothetical protein
MSTGDKTSLKQVLREECLPALGGLSKYYSLEAVKAWLLRRKIHCPAATLNRYFHEFTRARLIFSAGRGWYSTLATPFALNREPVSSAVQELNKTFPLLDFSCWSTAQIGGYGHHLLASFVTFIHTDRDSMESVVEALRRTGWTAHRHPTRLEAAKSFRPSDKTVVVRPAVSRAPVDGKYASIEKILVDLRAETASLPLLDAGEYHRLVANFAGRERISVASVAQYAKRRNLKLAEVLPSLID